MESKFIKLQCNCPPSCQCGAKEAKTWSHQKCSQQSYINCNGDIFCMNTRLGGGCEPFFIQNARFQCEISRNKGNTWMQYRAASEFLMGIAQAMQSAKFEIKNDNDLVDFGTTLTKQVMTRWAR